MAETRVPDWWMGLGREQARAVQNAFQELLRDLPMSQAQLAREINVAQPTVGRWARGQTKPSLQHMILAAEAIAERVGTLKRRVDRVGAALKAIQEAQEAWDTGEVSKVVEATQRVTKVLEGMMTAESGRDRRGSRGSSESRSK